MSNFFLKKIFFFNTALLPFSGVATFYSGESSELKI